MKANEIDNLNGDTNSENQSEITSSSNNDINNEEVLEKQASKLVIKSILLLLLSIIGYVVAFICLFSFPFEMVNGYEPYNIEKIDIVAVLIPHLTGLVIFIIELLLIIKVIKVFINAKNKIVKKTYLALVITIIGALIVLYSLNLYFNAIIEIFI